LRLQLSILYWSVTSSIQGPQDARLLKKC